MKSRDYYAILGVGRGASRGQIAKAFRKAAFRWHPDRNPGREALAHRQFLLVREAYEVLGDPNRRREYDEATRDHMAVAPASPHRRESPRGGNRVPSAARARVVPKARRNAVGSQAAPQAPRERARLWVSRLAFVPLAILFRVFGFLAAGVAGPESDRANARWDRWAERFPFTHRVLFPFGRISVAVGLLLFGIVLLRRTLLLESADDVMFSPSIDTAVRLVLLSGVLVFAIERVAFGIAWASNCSRRRGHSD